MNKSDETHNGGSGGYVNGVMSGAAKELVQQNDRPSSTSSSRTWVRLNVGGKVSRCGKKRNRSNRLIECLSKLIFFGS